jgi:radical SAM protein with 4Fe4S-binding SPASM domain
MASIPEFAYSWRPFASRKLITRATTDRTGLACTFAIDPETQRWGVLTGPALEILRLADGARRYSDIIRLVKNDDWDATLLASELFETGLLYDGVEPHRIASLPVYNACQPVGLHLEITNACNMTCTHCYVASGIKLPNEMNDEELRRAVDLLPPHSGKRIAISGGEPIVRRGCMELVEYALIERGHDVDLYTNGRLFPRKFAERIAQLNTRGVGRVRLQLSLEGATSVIHDLVRGHGAFADAMTSLQMFGEIGLAADTVIFVCLTKANVHEVDDLIRLAERHGVGMLVFSQWQRQGNASDTPWASIAPTTEEWVAIGERLLTYEHSTLKVHGNFYGDLSNGGQLCLSSPLFPKHVYYYNAFPRITPQGDILADQLWVDPNWCLGNVKVGDTLEQCFDRPAFHGQLQQMRDRVANIEECSSCEWRALCEGGSPGHTYAEYGHMQRKDLFCESRKYWFERYLARQMELI